VSANISDIGSGPARLDPYIAADARAQERQPLHERRQARLIFRIIRGCGQEYADAPYSLGLLRARGNRPRRRRAAEG
jgi:hypothetical protein